MPSSRPTGATLKVRIDGAPSGKISHGGLNYIHDMATDYLVKAGTPASIHAGLAQVARDVLN